MRIATITLSFAVCLLLFAPNANARGVAYYGEYQLVWPGKATTRAKATISIPGGLRPKGRTYEINCTSESMLTGDGRMLTTFESNQCIRKGYHILCHKDRKLASGETVTHVCWGDIYNKPKKSVVPKKR
jgi:hypothetical protein